MNLVLPWHHLLWQQMRYCWQQNRLSHALLLAGPPGMGKTLFAQRLANLLLCEQPVEVENQAHPVNWQPCEQCQACHLVTVGNHPDLFSVHPSAADKPISVEQIRELIQFCSLTTYYGRYRIVLINPAETMNHHAANSLLKLLEEPPPQTLFILVSHQPQQLIITLRSRCQLLNFSRPNRQLTQAWLQNRLAISPPTLNNKADIALLLNLSAQAPLLAFALVETGAMTQRQALFDSLIRLATEKMDPIKVVAQWTQGETVPILPWLLSWTGDIIRGALTGQTRYLLNQDYQTHLLLFSQQVDLKNLFSLLDQQIEVYQLIRANTPVKVTGLLESIAIAWVKLTHSPRRSSL
ncbi:DNA polymerase III subunit delta' [Thioploca ingrica]|uniref:DNA polymerase III subunit delta' n=1 Tax=Thioploca ingrica TaxID=40754 RepID=A0A090BV97_9GAMM|nr:DNA polymerase III subunit delta' [Thioploca ingrica]